MKLIHGDCLEVMKSFDDNSIDMCLTSPPYDNLRTYNNSLYWNFRVFKEVASELKRIIRRGGVIVWVVGDATIKGSETGTSFKQALYFKDIGFNIHDTMIYKKKNPMPNIKSMRYRQSFEYMFILSKGKAVIFNPIMIDIKRFDTGNQRRRTGEIEGYSKNYTTNKKRKKDNVFEYGVGGITTGHPAIFPEKLALDQILSWSNENGTVLDPFMGSGTTGVACKNLNRNFIGIEKDNKYFKIASDRINGQ